MGDDQKFIDDIVYTAKELSPNFIAIAGTPIPTMIGTDFKAIANIIEKETNIPTFGFDTTGMHSYVSGADVYKRQSLNPSSAAFPVSPEVAVSITTSSFKVFFSIAVFRR